MANNRNNLKVVVCVNNNHANLTVDKSYMVHDEFENKYIIQDDSGVLRTYYKNRFK